MLAARVRSGLVETYHEGAVAACAPDGSLIASHGDIDRPFFIRSAAKPFQAYVSQTLGADMSDLEMAMAAASHRGHPVQVALVSRMLRAAGLEPSDLGCPPNWPLSHEAVRRLAGTGETQPRSLWHNCSGKHAGFLRACVARGWPTASYLSPEHPLQRAVASTLADFGGFAPGPPGVDGCGAPVFVTTTRVLAILFARLASSQDLQPVFRAMHQYPCLVGENGAPDSAIATALNGVAKGGAEGCMGVGLAGGLGLGVKSWDGSGQVAAVAAVAALGQLGRLGDTARHHLAFIASPPVSGGVQVVGSLEPRVVLY